MTLHEAITRARRRLERAGIDAIEAAVDAELLARTALGWDRARIIASMPLPLPDGFADEYDALVARRERREPAAYIVGWREFWNRDFEVGPGVLVPRPETELIVEEALAQLAPRIAAVLAGTESRPPVLADVGTGSGCVAITLALEIPRVRIVATDTSRDALDVAARNAERHGVSERLQFVETDLLAGVDACFDLIVSNPPYLAGTDIATLQPEVRDYEPREALAGGPDGVDAIRELLRQGESSLRKGGLLLFEFGFGQEDLVREAIAMHPAYRLKRIRADLQGIPRTAVLTWDAGNRIGRILRSHPVRLTGM